MLVCCVLTCCPDEPDLYHIDSGILAADSFGSFGKRSETSNPYAIQSVSVDVQFYFLDQSAAPVGSTKLNLSLDDCLDTCAVSLEPSRPPRTEFRRMPIAMVFPTWRVSAT